MSQENSCAICGEEFPSILGATEHPLKCGKQYARDAQLAQVEQSDDRQELNRERERKKK